jgi:beta-phosphoglucomutase-like phosphatase (HAD superfamily)
MLHSLLPISAHQCAGRQPQGRPADRAAGYAVDGGGSRSAGVHAVITSCRDSGRTLTVVSNNSARAVRAYLARHALDGPIGVVVYNFRSHATKPSTTRSLRA